jgi:hypothetical protein
MSDDESARSAVEALFDAVRQYRPSVKFMELLNFMARFRRYSPYNCLLLHVQNSKLDCAATRRQWERDFRRQVNGDARPYVILTPMGPVRFVYDISDPEPMVEPGLPGPALVIRSAAE